MHKEFDYPPSAASAREERVHARYLPLFFVAFVLGMICGVTLVICR